MSSIELVLIFVIAILIYIIVDLVSYIRATYYFSENSPIVGNCDSLTVSIVLGSGGHTGEMMHLLKAIVEQKLFR